MKTYLQSFDASFAYPVLFTRDVFRPGNRSLADIVGRLGERKRHRVIVFVDDGVAKHHPDLGARIEAYCDEYGDRLELVMAPRTVPGGERIKNDYRLTMGILDTIMEYRLCRHSYVMAIGGGAVLDAVGFAASIVHRGLRTIRLPTTVLAQNDAGVGVKTGMNLHGGKNTVGTFHPPFAVVNDFAFLGTLPDREWQAGIAEAYKVAMIKDADFFRFLTAHASALRDRDAGAMEHLVARCAELHLDHIRDNGDPFEMGTAHPLDFGHWAAHKLESMSGYRIGHGQAVAAGVALDACYACRLGWLTREEFDATCRGLTQSGLPVWYEEMDRRLGDGTPELLQGLDDFREHLGGELCVTFPDGIGAKQEIHDVDAGLMEECLARVRSSVDPQATRPTGTRA